MRKVKVLILLCAVVVFCGVSVFSFAAAKVNWPKYPGAKVNFMWYPSPEMEAIKKMLPQFKKLTGIDVTLTELPHEEVFKKRMMDAVSGAGEFDIYPLQPSVTRLFADSGYIVPFDDFWKSPEDVEYNDLFEGVRMMYEYKGKVYGIPLYPDIIMLFYNKKMMDAAKAPIPKTFDEYEKVCKSFIKDTDGDGKPDQWGSVLNLKGGDWSIMNNLALFMYMNKVDWYYGQIAADRPVKEGDPKWMRPMLDDPKAIEAYAYLVKLYKDQVFSPGSINFSYFEAMESFSTGKVPMYLGFGDQAPMIVGPDSLVKEDVRVAPVPTWHGVRRSFTGGWGASISAFSKNKEAAYTFLRYFYGNSANQKELSRNGQTPSRASVLMDPVLQKEFVWYSAMGEMLKYAKPLPLIPEFEEFVTGLEPILTEALLGTMTPKDAMIKSNQLLGDIMKKAGYIK
jgi:multiple sugar transport system substrate-binding protein